MFYNKTCSHDIVQNYKMNHRLLFLVLVAHARPKKVICHAVISSLMYGMLKHVLLSSLCKNKYLGVGIPVYTCLSKRPCHFTHKFVSLPFLTHTTYIRFFFWPAIQAAQRPAIQHAFQSESAKEKKKKKRGERREKGKEGKERRGK